MSNGSPVVRALTKDDINTVRGSLEAYDKSLNGLFYLGTWNGETTRNNSPIYWLASANTSNGLWYVSYNGSLGSSKSNEFGVRPVVSLKPEVRVTTQDASGAWNIEI